MKTTEEHCPVKIGSLIYDNGFYDSGDIRYGVGLIVNLKNGTIEKQIETLYPEIKQTKHWGLNYFNMLISENIIKIIKW